MKQLNKLKIDHRWLVVFLCFYSCCLHSGCLIYAFSLFIAPFQTEFGWDRTTIMFAFTIQLTGLGLAAPFVGKIVDSKGARIVLCLGSLLASLGFLSFVFMETVPHLYLSSIIIGIGSSAMGPVTCSTAVSDIFKEKRGLAIGIMSTGIGVGGFVVAPLLGGYCIPNFGWGGAYICMAVLTIIMIPLTLFIMKKGTPYKKDTLEGKQGTEFKQVPNNSKNAFLSIPFILISVAFFLYLFSIVGALQSQVPYLQDIGFPLLTASSALGGLALVSAFAKLFFGWLCDKIKPVNVFVIGNLFTITGIFLLMNIKPGASSGFIWFYAVIFGIGAGSWLPIMSMMVSKTFGMSSYGMIFGAVSLVQTIGSATGPLAAGYIYDMTNNYHLAFTLFIILTICSIPIMMGAKSRNVRRKTSPRILINRFLADKV